jgi:hypothetical protein
MNIKIMAFRNRERTGIFPPRVSDEIREGYFLVRDTQGYVPACIRKERPKDPLTGEVLDRSPVWVCVVDGFASPDPEDIRRVAEYGVEITREEYRGYLIGGEDA